MKYKEFLAVVLGFIVAQYSFASDDLATKTKLPGTNDKCAAYCLATYSPHTSEEPKSANACKQGCRLYSMLQFTKETSLENVGSSCDSACKEAYDDQKSPKRREACFAGCHHQSPFTTGREARFGRRAREEISDGRAMATEREAHRSHSPAIRNFLPGSYERSEFIQMEISVDQNSPISDYAHHLFDGMFDRMEDMHRNVMKNFRSFWSDDSSEVSSPFASMNKEMDNMQKHMNEMMDGLLGQRKPQDSSSDASKEQKTRDLNPLYRFAQSQKQDGVGGMQVGNKDKNGNDILEVRMSFPTVRKGDHGETIIEFAPNMRLNYGSDSQDRTGTLESARAFEPSPPVDRDPTKAVDPDASWLACLARRARRLSSITRWLVCLALMLCVLCMMWICLSIMKTAPRRRILYAKTSELKVDPTTTEKKFLMESFAQPPPEGAPPPYQEEAEPLPTKTETA